MQRRCRRRGPCRSHLHPDHSQGSIHLPKVCPPDPQEHPHEALPASQPKARAAPQPCSHLPHGPHPQLARDENGQPRKLCSQKDSGPSNVIRGRRWLPGYKLAPALGARAHTPEAHNPQHMHT